MYIPKDPIIRRWNWKRCIPLKIMVTVILAAVVVITCGLTMAPFVAYFGGGIR